jgi:hypothetical protein
MNGGCAGKITIKSFFTLYQEVIKCFHVYLIKILRICMSGVRRFDYTDNKELEMFYVFFIYLYCFVCFCCIFAVN